MILTSTYKESNEIGPEVYKFCVVRNPYRRTFSYFKHLLRQVDLVKEPFEYFLREIKNKVFYQRTPMYSYPQSLYVLDTDGEIGRDLNIFRFENLEELEDSLKVKLPHTNVGNYTDEDYYELTLKKTY